MMTGFLIASICATASPHYHSACFKSSEAFINQTGLQRSFGVLEAQLIDTGNRYGKSYLGEQVFSAAAIVGGAGVKFIRDHEIEYRFKVHKFLPFDYIQPGVQNINDSKRQINYIGIGWTW